MISEWMKVMLDEIARKRAEAEQARIEERIRLAEQGGRDAEAGRDEPIASPRSSADRARG